jgi:Predicted nucleic acid-binding protein, contains PIN domain
MIVVADTGPISHLSEADALSLLDSSEEFLTPDTAIGELERSGTPAVTGRTRSSPRMTPRADLYPGERAVLAVASERDAVLLTDDLAARPVAESSDAETHGSIGVVLCTRVAGCRQGPTVASSAHDGHDPVSPVHDTGSRYQPRGRTRWMPVVTRPARPVPPPPPVRRCPAPR